MALPLQKMPGSAEIHFVCARFGDSFRHPRIAANPLQTTVRPHSGVATGVDPRATDRVKMRQSRRTHSAHQSSTPVAQNAPLPQSSPCCQVTTDPERGFPKPSTNGNLEVGGRPLLGRDVGLSTTPSEGRHYRFLPRQFLKREQVVAQSPWWYELQFADSRPGSSPVPAAFSGHLARRVPRPRNQAIRSPEEDLRERVSGCWGDRPPSHRVRVIRTTGPRTGNKTEIVEITWFVPVSSKRLAGNDWVCTLGSDPTTGHVFFIRYLNGGVSFPVGTTLRPPHQMLRPFPSLSAARLTNHGVSFAYRSNTSGRTWTKPPD